MKTAMILFALLCLSGCLSTSLEHPNGSKYQCEAVGFGMISLPVAFAMRGGCVDRAMSQGFHPVGVKMEEQ